METKTIECLKYIFTPEEMEEETLMFVTDNQILNKLETLDINKLYNIISLITHRFFNGDFTKFPSSPILNASKKERLIKIIILMMQELK